MRDSQENFIQTKLSLEANSFRTGILLAVVGTALFGLKSILIKLAYREGVDATTLLTLRLLFAMPFYLAMMLWLLLKEKKRTPTRKDFQTICVLGFIGHYLSAYLDMEGLTYISTQLERLTLYTFPLMTTLLGWLFLKEVISKRVIIALFLTYSGVMLLYWFEVGEVGESATIGIMLVLAAALSFSCYVVFSKVYISKIGSRLFTAISMLASIVYMMIHFSVTRELADLNQSVEVLGYGFLLAFFCTVIPSFLMAEAVARIGPSRSSIVGTAGPIFTIALAVWLLDEPFGLTHFGGMLLVILGVSMLSKR
jgi:drug/metabolite transporter (DMT)-like permease